MANKKKYSLAGSIKDVLLLVPNLVSIARNITTLINLEARLAGKTALVLIVLSVVYAVLIVSVWLCVLALLFIYLLSLHLSPSLSLLVILVLNIALLVIIGFIISRIKKNLFFPVTSKQCRDLCKIDQ